MISSLPDELLVEVFDWCRLDDEYRWSHLRRWYYLLQVCRKWRYVMLEWATCLKLRFLCNSANPITTMPSHLTQIPLIIRFKFLYPVPTLFRENLVLALQNRDRVYDISISNWGSEDLGLHKALGNVFPVLETLSLPGVHTRRDLPFDFVAPRLRALHLRAIDVSTGCLSLTNAMKLSSLRLETNSAIPLEFLVASIANMPYLENISISFLQKTPLPGTVMELPSTQITCVVLPRLTRLLFRGCTTYLENLLSQIDTPFLQDLRFTCFSEGFSSVVRLSAFLGTLQNLDFQAAVIRFTRRFIAITYHSDRPSVGSPYANFIMYHSDAGGDGVHLGTSLLQICDAVAPALSAVESLALEVNSDGAYRPGFILEPTFWHTFLRLFVGVKTLTIDVPFAMEISDALRPNNGAVITELLPVLSELVIVCYLVLHNQPFSSFANERCLAGSPIVVRTIQHRPPSLRPPPISWSFDPLIWTI